MASKLSTGSTSQPDSQLKYASRKRLTNSEWDSLAIDLMNSVLAALSDREDLDENLEDWNALYEMLTPAVDNEPTVGSSNIFVPLIPSELEALLAYIAAQVLVPQPFIVTGNTPQAAEFAHQIERYYNIEYKKRRFDTTWFEEFVKWLHFALRDGNAYMEVLWKYDKTQKRVLQSQPRMEPDPETQLPAPVLGDDQKPIYDQTEMIIDDVQNDVDMRAVSLRDVIRVPANAESIESAVAVIRGLFLMEADLQKLTYNPEKNKDGVLDAEEVELALKNVPVGNTEVPMDQQPTGVLTEGEQVGIGAGQGTQASKFFKNRGPIKVYRIHSRQYDMDGDGIPEENVFWVHATTWRMLGWTRYQYFNGRRPFFSFAPFARPGQEDGFALPERLAGLQNETNAQRKTRLDLGTRNLSPPFIIKKGSSLEDANMAWGMNQRWETEEPTTDIFVPQLPGIPQEAFIEEQQLKQDAKEYTGMANPMMGVSNSGRRSATEARQWQAAAMTRTGLLAMRFRLAIRGVVNFVHDLKKQYLTSDQTVTSAQGSFTLPLPVLQQDVTIDIAGASDPIDANARRTETMTAVDIFMRFPWIAGNPVRQFYLARKLADTFNWADIDQIVGTQQDAIQAAQMAAQQPPQQQNHPPQQKPAKPPMPGKPQ